MLARRLPPPVPRSMILRPADAAGSRRVDRLGARGGDGLAAHGVDGLAAHGVDALAARGAAGLGPAGLGGFGARGVDGLVARRVEGRWRRSGRQPTRSPRGQLVRWWTRPAPRGDEALWRAVRIVQEERLRIGLTVTDLARRLEASGRPLRRESLSRILQGKQATTWETVEALAEVLGVRLDDCLAG